MDVYVTAEARSRIGTEISRIQAPDQNPPDPRTEANLEEVGTSNDVLDNKGSYGFLGSYARKLNPFNYNLLRDLKRAGNRQKRGPQEMKVYLTMCKKIKGKKISSANV
jgi:hypothetical protein